MPTPDMFGKPRKPREWLMHVYDAGSSGCCNPGDDDDLIVKFQCGRCGNKTDWMKQETVTKAKRGIPCPACNQEQG